MVNILKRKIERDILEYFGRNDAPILLIDGARQVGKSFIIRHLGQSHFENYVEINMMEDMAKDRVFEDVKGIDDMYLAIQSVAGRKLGGYDDTLVFLDEIQEHPYIFTLLKFLREDRRYRFIASGSLLGVALRKTQSIPLGSVSVKRMYPMDFEEFLWANGIGDEVTEHLRGSFRDRTSLNDGIHRRMLSLFKDYLICGGLPYCVDLFLSERDLIGLRDVQKTIFRLYGDDASRYDAVNRLRTKAILDLVPSTMESRRKRVFMKDIEGKEKARFSEYTDDFDSLISSGVVLDAKCCSNPCFRLLETAKRNMMKLYMLDVGILTSLLYGYQIKALRSDEPQVNLGNVYETVVAEILSSTGRELYYTDSKKMGELDFLIDDYGNMSVIAIEVKSGRNPTAHRALDRHLSEDDRISEGWVFSNDCEIRTDGKITYYPIYMVNFIDGRL